jgi:hypothetical protein
LASELRTVGVSPAHAHRCRRWETVDVADFGDDQHAQVAADVLGALVDLARERVDLAVKVGDQPQQRFESLATSAPSTRGWRSTAGSSSRAAARSVPARKVRRWPLAPRA